MGIREEVLETIIDVIRAAKEAGASDLEAEDIAHKTFPGTPSIAIIEAGLELSDRETEAWWQQVERTIDGEIIRKAIGFQAEGGAQ